MIVRAINVRQPWCWFITELPKHYSKKVENRTWRLRNPDGSPYFGPLVLVASASCSAEEYDDACEMALRCGVPTSLLPARETLELGGIVGAVQVVGFAEPDLLDGPWHVPGCIGWQLDRAIALPFRRYRGKQGPFTVELTDAEAEAMRSAGILQQAA